MGPLASTTEDMGKIKKSKCKMRLPDVRPQYCVSFSFGVRWVDKFECSSDFVSG